jgi:Xaa-Pro aminopeptidase
MSSYADRLKALREQLKASQLDGFVVPLTDEHMSEYVGSYAQRLAWLTGFQGSAGSAVVLPEEAAIFVDGRYTLQVRQQVSETEWSYQSVPETSTTQWLEEHAPEGARIGYDPWLHTRDWVAKAKEALASRGAELVPVERNPIDEIWTDRPEASKAHLVVQSDEHAGKSAAEKAHRDRRLAWKAPRRRGGALRARFDRLGVQHPWGRRDPYAGGAGLCLGPCRRHGRPVRRV